MTVDGLGVRWRWQAGQAVEWKNLTRFLESETLFLLYTSSACFNIVPKRAFAQGEAESFSGTSSRAGLTPADD
jgi:YcxB-like protein